MSLGLQCLAAVLFSALFSLGVILVHLPWRALKSKDPRERILGSPKELVPTCPYEYIRNIYGRHHWAPFVAKLAPNLKESDSDRYTMVLEIMDCIHLCLIMVDDITDDSDYRKGRPAAHIIYGRSETANRAYLRVSQIINKTTQDFPRLAPWVTQSLAEILEGQDISLVWRRDGLTSFPKAHDERVIAYRCMSSLKTGALFRLLGRLVLENRSMDDTLSQVGYYSQLQNDCKNVFSSEYAKAKGTLAEDLRNRELTYPIILALNEPEGFYIEKAFESGSPRDIQNAIGVIQSENVYRACLDELKQYESNVREWVTLWGRKEKLDLTH
uniref:Prenyl transferase nodC n=1 Tax=Hypoxylon pulicicidum TaxID=1243767 RepID=NODC_HYPPI|nr:RecName: Full=Prenyl transferase nodC; AltName: Full=Nodulisporic acid biosynthesis cluster protein C [Hypoxylon pulicicidum]AUM60067.1 geranylgeranyl transferase [Hypoxylon pulicicidum]